MFVLMSMIVYCPVLDGWLASQPHLAGRGGNVPWKMSLAHHYLISSSAQYLSAFTCTSLSSSYLSSSSAAHGPIPIFGPFIPIIASQEEGDFDFWQPYILRLCHFLLCRCLFNCKEARSWHFGIWDASTFNSYSILFPTFYGVMEILQ